MKKPTREQEGKKKRGKGPRRGGGRKVTFTASGKRSKRAAKQGVLEKGYRERGEEPGEKGGVENAGKN